MPTGYERPIRMNKVVGTTDVTRSEIPYSENGNKGYYYQIVHTGITKLIRIVGMQTDDLIEILYSSSYTPMVSDFDYCALPDSFGILVIAHIVAGKLGIEKGIPN